MAAKISLAFRDNGNIQPMAANGEMKTMAKIMKYQYRNVQLRNGWQ